MKFHYAIVKKNMFICLFLEQLFIFALSYPSTCCPEFQHLQAHLQRPHRPEGSQQARGVPHVGRPEGHAV